MRPECVRAVGVRVGRDGRDVSVFLPTATSETTLRNFEDNGAITACFTAMSHRSTQLKGRTASIRAATARDLEIVDRYVRAIAGVLGTVGVPPKFVVRMTTRPCRVVRFVVDALFDQTPGPRAGEPLASEGGAS
jgi:hypothetical protein